MICRPLINAQYSIRNGHLLNPTKSQAIVIGVGILMLYTMYLLIVLGENVIWYRGPYRLAKVAATSSNNKNIKIMAVELLYFYFQAIVVLDI